MFFLAFPLLLYTRIYSITAMLFRVRPASAVKIRIAWKFPLEPQFCVCFVKQRIECPCSIHCYSNGNGAKCSPYFFFLILLLHVQMASQQHIVFGCTMYKCFGDGHRSHVLRFICVKYFEQFHSEYCAWYFKRIGRHWSADGKFIQSQRK